MASPPPHAISLGTINILFQSLAMGFPFFQLPGRLTHPIPSIPLFPQGVPLTLRFLQGLSENSERERDQVKKSEVQVSAKLVHGSVGGGTEDLVLLIYNVNFER